MKLAVSVGVTLLSCALQFSCASVTSKPTGNFDRPSRTPFDFPELTPVIASIVETEWPLGLAKTAVSDAVLVVLSIQPASARLVLVFSEVDDSRTKLSWSFRDSRGQRRLVSMRRLGQVAETSAEFVDDYGRFVGFIDAAGSRVYSNDELLMFDLMVSRGSEKALRERWIGCVRWTQMQPIDTRASSR